MENIFLTDTFWSAVKRKNVQDLLAIVFEEAGHTEAAEIAKNTTRMTELAMKKMKDALGETQEDVPDSDKSIDPTELDYVEEPAEDDTITVGDIKALLKEGSKKSLKAAKKAFKAQFTKDHPDHKMLKKLIKTATK